CELEDPRVGGARRFRRWRRPRPRRPAGVDRRRQPGRANRSDRLPASLRSMSRATPEDLINTVIRADNLRRRARGQPSTRAAVALQTGRPSSSRLFIEPFFNLLGWLWGSLMYAMPWPLRKAFVQWVNLKMSAHAPAGDPRLAERIQEMLRLAKELKSKSGR